MAQININYNDRTSNELLNWESSINNYGEDYELIIIKKKKLINNPFGEVYKPMNCCENCPNNPLNNPYASGFCNCALPSLTNPIW